MRKLPRLFPFSSRSAAATSAVAAAAAALKVYLVTDTGGCIPLELHPHFGGLVFKTRTTVVDGLYWSYSEISDISSTKNSNSAEGCRQHETNLRVPQITDPPD